MRHRCVLRHRAYVSCCDLHLRLPYIIGRRTRHAVQVRCFKRIRVHQDKIPNTEVYELLGNYRTHAAEADDGNAQILKRLLSRQPESANLAVEDFRSRSTTVRRVENHFPMRANPDNANLISRAEGAAPAFRPRSQPEPRE